MAFEVALPPAPPLPLGLPAPPAPPVRLCWLPPPNQCQPASAVLVAAIALALPPVPPLPPLNPTSPAPPLPPVPPVAFAVLLGSLFGAVIAVAAPPGPPSVPGPPTPSTPLMPAVPTTSNVAASAGRAKPKATTDVKIRNLEKEFVCIIEPPCKPHPTFPHGVCQSHPTKDSGLTFRGPRCPQTSTPSATERRQAWSVRLAAFDIHGRAMKSPSKPSLREHQHEVLLLSAK